MKLAFLSLVLSSVAFGSAVTYMTTCSVFGVNVTSSDASCYVQTDQGYAVANAMLDPSGGIATAVVSAPVGHSGYHNGTAHTIAQFADTLTIYSPNRVPFYIESHAHSLSGDVNIAGTYRVQSGVATILFSLSAGACCFDPQDRSSFGISRWMIYDANNVLIEDAIVYSHQGQKYPGLTMGMIVGIPEPSSLTITCLGLVATALSCLWRSLPRTV